MISVFDLARKRSQTFAETLATQVRQAPNRLSFVILYLVLIMARLHIRQFLSRFSMKFFCDLEL